MKVTACNKPALKDFEPNAITTLLIQNNDVTIASTYPIVLKVQLSRIYITAVQDIC